MSTFFVFVQCFTKLFKRDWHIHCRGVDKSEEQDVSSDLLVGMQSRLPVIVIRSKPGWTFKFSMFNVRSGLLIAFTRAPCHLRVRCTSRQLSSAFHCMDLKREIECYEKGVSVCFLVYGPHLPVSDNNTNTDWSRPVTSALFSPVLSHQMSLKWNQAVKTETGRQKLEITQLSSL